MKRVLIIGLALILLLVSVAPAAAQGIDWPISARNVYTFHLLGSVKSIDPKTPSFDVVVESYAPPRPLPSPILKMYIDRGTIFIFLRPVISTGIARPGLKDLKEGDRVLVLGVARDHKHTARVVVVGVPGPIPVDDTP